MKFGTIVLRVNMHRLTIVGVRFSIWRHAFKMMAKTVTSFHAKKSFHLVSAHAASASS